MLLEGVERLWGGRWWLRRDGRRGSCRAWCIGARSPSPGAGLERLCRGCRLGWLLRLDVRPATLALILDETSNPSGTKRDCAARQMREGARDDARIVAGRDALPQERPGRAAQELLNED